MLTLKQIVRWKKYNLSLPKLAVLIAAEKPLPEAELSRRAGVSLSMLQRFVQDSQGLLKVVKYSESRGYKEGRPASKAIVRTNKAVRLLN